MSSAAVIGTLRVKEIHYHSAVCKENVLESRQPTLQSTTALCLQNIFFPYTV